jgi:hypothetical protein
MKTACRTQCGECPFRSTSLGGYLGSYDGPGGVHSSLWHGDPFFCHPKIDYGQRDWLSRAMESGHLCTGALIFVGRQEFFPKSADPEIARALAWAMAQYAAKPERFDVLEPRAFVAHHSEGESAAFFRAQRAPQPG